MSKTDLEAIRARADVAKLEPWYNKPNQTSDVPLLLAEIDRLRGNAAAEPDALMNAADEIADLCGCPQWDYPGQLVRDVAQLKEQRDRAQADVARLRALALELAKELHHERSALSIIRDRQTHAGIATIGEQDLLKGITQISAILARPDVAELDADGPVQP